MEKIERIKELVNKLNDASNSYYNENREIMSNLEYDKLYDELLLLEEETGIIMSKSPTQTVQCEMMDELVKVKHSKPMLSANKSKDVNDLVKFLGKKQGILSWKLDGLTIVITYVGGKYKQAVTRGGGDIGEDVTINIATCINLPHTIPYNGELIVRGECTISYANFEKINNTIEDVSSKYRNSRNLSSGSVRQLNSNVAAQRYLEFKAFAIVKSDLNINTKDLQFQTLNSFGIDTVEYKLVDQTNLLQTINEFKPSEYGTPVDGLILEFNDVLYGESLGSTNKYTLNMMALKWEDELVETIFRGVELKTSRYGTVSITALFDSVEIDGTTISRASLHNVDIFNSLELGIGDRIRVYKANMIIPQISDNLDRTGTYQLPVFCPSCGTKLQVVKRVDTNELYCDNEDCKSMLLGKLTHFASKPAMNIDGLSEATLEFLIDKGWVEDYLDLYLLEDHKSEWMRTEGFGKSSVTKLFKAIEESKNVNFENFLYSQGIRNVGKDASKKISKLVNGDFNKFMELIGEWYDFSNLDGVGEVISKSIYDWRKIFGCYEGDRFLTLVGMMNFIEQENTVSNSKTLDGKSFCITGSLIKYPNRDALVKDIESHGGKVVSGVTKKTDLLLTNDVSSGSSKNQKAKELNIPIITEEQFIEMIN